MLLSVRVKHVTGHNLYMHIFSVENQKGAINIQRHSIESQKNAIAVQNLGDSALLLLNGTYLSGDKGIVPFWLLTDDMGTSWMTAEIYKEGQITNIQLLHNHCAIDRKMWTVMK